MRKSEGLTSRLRASSRALDLDCLIGRGAVRIPCKYFTVGLVDRTTAESGWENVASAERRVSWMLQLTRAALKIARSRTDERHCEDWLIC